MSKELIINACLAGFWAGLAAFSAGGTLDKAALFAAGRGRHPCGRRLYRREARQAGAGGSVREP